MALIVPEAQTPFSPVQQPRIDPNTPGIGDALSTVGDTLVAIEGAKVQRRRESAMREARVQTIERLGELRTQYEQDTDYNGLSDRFSAAAQAAMDDIAKGLPDDQLRNDYMLDARATVAPQKQAFAKLEYGLEREEGRASGRAQIRQYINESAAAPDEESRHAIMSDLGAHIGSMFESGYIDAEEAEKMLADAATDSNLALAIRIADDDPELFLEREAEGTFNALDPVTRQRFKNAAKADIAARDTQIAKTVAAETKANAKALEATVTDAQEILESGRPYKGLPDLFDAVKGTPLEAELKASMDAAQTAGNFAVLNPDEQAQILAGIEKKPTNDPADLKRKERLDAMHGKTVESIKSDPLAHVDERGIMVLPPLDLSDPASVRMRLSLAETVAEDYPVGDGTPNLRLFTNRESETIRAQIAGADPDAQLAIAVDVVNGFGPYAPEALAEVGAEDPLFEMAGQLVLQTGKVSAARAMLTGRRLIADKTAATADKATRETVRSTIAEIFPETMADRLPMLFEAADALYAVSGQMANPDAEPAARRKHYMQALQSAAGQVTERGRILGGIQSVNGRQTLLPPTVDGAMVELMLENAKPEDWAKASVSGNTPMWGRNPLPDQFDQPGSEVYPDVMRLVSVGGGQYLMAIQRRNGELRYLTDAAMPDGKARLSLDQLIKLSGKR